MKRVICLFICAAVLLTVLPQPSANAAPAPNPRLRVGLSFGTNALVAANLDNHTGSGYEFGYLDGEMNFIPLGATAQTKITMVKNRNVYLSDNTYSDTPSNVAVGAFHTAHGSHLSRAEAENAAALLREEGILAFVSYDSGVWKVRSNSFTASADGRETGSNRCISVVITGTTEIIFQFDYGTEFHLCVRPIAPEGVRAQTWHRSRRYYGMFEFRRMDGNDLTVINAVEMQDYIKGVVPYEMSPSWPLEALKAQAVSARSFAAGSLVRHRNDGFSVCTTTHCQVYFGTASASANSDRAVDETYGMYMLHNGVPCTTVSYHAASGGATEDSENVWFAAIPYLRGVPDPYENPAQIPGYNWSYTVTNAQISAYLNQIGVTNSGVANFYIDTVTRMGNARSVTVIGTDGRTLLTRTGDNARSFIGNLARTYSTLPRTYSYSLRFTINAPGGPAFAALTSGGQAVDLHNLSALYVIDGRGNVTPLPSEAMLIDRGGTLHGLPVQPGGVNTGTYVVTGRGNGHNVGMSQWGARGMADQGYTYEQILSHYYTGITISSG
jgi:stage II sporulation protein D